MHYRIGVDIGGTSVKTGVVNDCFKVVEKGKIPTAKRTADAIINDIIDSCNSFAEKYDIDSIGIGSAGYIDSKNGIVKIAGNLPFENEPVVSKIISGTGLPAKIDNDGNCALIGEYAAGAARGYEDAVIMTVGTGIGGAIMTGGKIYHGVNNRAGEIGHFVFNPNGPECKCGLRGCYEKYASATALINMTKKAADEFPESILAKKAFESLDGRTAFLAYDENCPVAAEVLNEYIKILAMGINSYINIFRPQIIILSGGIANEKERLIKLLSPYLFEDTIVTTTALNGDGGLIGASLLGTKYAEN